jgi:uncharacterized protein YciI
MKLLATAVAATYACPMHPEVTDRVRVVAPRHASYWKDLGLAHYRGGPFDDRTGGLITFDADDAAQAQRAVREDPFVLEGLIEARWLKQWTPASG